jgi:two-component system, chemotaxis family, chemotaxis protein CheY
MLPTALVIEDNSVVRAFIHTKLETSGWKVHEAENPTAALSIFRQLRPHLVTLDLVMPIDDGLDAIHLAMLIKDESPEVTLLVVSAVGSKLVHWYERITSSQDIKDFIRKHDLELFDKSPEDPTLKNVFARTDCLFHELSGARLSTRGAPAVSDRVRLC